MLIDNPLFVRDAEALVRDLWPAFSEPDRNAQYVIRDMVHWVADIAYETNPNLSYFTTNEFISDIEYFLEYEPMEEEETIAVMVGVTNSDYCSRDKTVQEVIDLVIRDFIECAKECLTRAAENQEFEK